MDLGRFRRFLGQPLDNHPVIRVIKAAISIFFRVIGLIYLVLAFHFLINVVSLYLWPSSWQAQLPFLFAGLGLAIWFANRLRWFKSRPEEGRRVLPLIWLTLGILLISWISGRAWDWRMARMKRSLKAEGIPVSVADLVGSVPPVKNAANALERWSADFTRTRPGESRVDYKKVSDCLLTVDGAGITATVTGERDERKAWDQASLSEFDAAIKKNARYFRAVEDGLTSIVGRYERYIPTECIKKGSSYDFPVISTSRYLNAARIYRVIAERRAMKGEQAGAWQSVRAQMRLVRLVGQVPESIAGFLCVAMDGITVTTVCKILQNRRDWVIPPDAARELEQIASNRSTQRMCEVNIAEVIVRFSRTDAAASREPVSLMGTVSAIVSFDPESVCEAFSALYEKPQKLSGANSGFLAYFINQYLPTARMREWNGKPARPYDEHREERRSIFLRMFQWADHSDMYDSELQRQCENASSVKLALAASAVHAYRNRMGRYPAKLADLVPKDIDAALLTDIFTNKEFGYKVAKGGCEISSPGPWGTGMDSRGQAMVFREPLPAGKPAKKKT
jgi:hypothetical protein